MASLVMQKVPAHGMGENLAFHNGDAASLDGWEPGRLALVIMRCLFEQPYFLACEAPIRGAVLRNSIFAPAVIANRLLRANCRAFVLATFLAAHELAAGYVDRGFILRRDLSALPDELVLLVGNVSAGVLATIVAFPETILTEIVARGRSDATTLAVSVKSLNAEFSEAVAR
ncbi:hypothetical protein [Paraburkholderia sp. UYCP14C]|uniref:hypothetical protein n=1 Tax=Paraburkholderia sp. UYCP14C TaxID=2511130 RepID=UPI0020071D52|nr:hypothetical protein [Paraburkholderia sp. UYCP14C]